MCIRDSALRRARGTGRTGNMQKNGLPTPEVDGFTPGGILYHMRSHIPGPRGSTRQKKPRPA
eukprot:2004928-Pyramimonas_sp.AAC.1